MPRCFVIQPFDGGPFDKRFDEVLTPAVEAAQLEAYRVDRDLSVSIPIDAIENGIRDAAACLADITTDNPNVWFELGFALACQKPLVLICSDSRRVKFPFDVQHRHVIRYRTESPKDFQNLGAEVTVRLKASLEKEESVQLLSQSALADTEGLEPHEIAALVLIAESGLEPDDAPSAYTLKQDMVKAGYTELAAVLGVKSLEIMGFVGQHQATTFNGDVYTAFVLQDAGTKWLMNNRDHLVLRPAKSRPSSDTEDDLPF
jgi:nucleoside 2-deoxyribosyltransferase